MGLVVLLLTLFITAKEIPCAPLYSVAQNTKASVHSSNQHSDHCIRHQDPLPQFESNVQSSTNSLRPLIALDDVLATIWLNPKKSPSRFLSNFDTKDHLGVSVYTFLGHFLI